MLRRPRTTYPFYEEAPGVADQSSESGASAPNPSGPRPEDTGTSQPVKTNADLAASYAKRAIKALKTDEVDEARVLSDIAGAHAALELAEATRDSSRA